MKITVHESVVFTEKFHEQRLLSTRDENGHSKGAHFHGKGVPKVMVKKQKRRVIPHLCLT